MNERLVIAGGPRCGKTSYANALHRLAVNSGADWPVLLHTDDLMHLRWSRASDVAADWMDHPGPWIIEGVATPRALRKRLDFYGAPCDRLIWMGQPHEELNAKQTAMHKGALTIMQQIQPELEARGVIIEER